MAELQHQQLLDRLLPGVLAAGKTILLHRERGLIVERKADGSPVSSADREAEAILLSALAHAAPGIPVVGEEGSSGSGVPKGSARFFLVDALDGTKGFVAGRNDFTVNIGLIEHGAPVFGIVYAPAQGWLFATAGARTSVEARIEPGASAGGPVQLDPQPIRTSPPDPTALRAVVSSSHPGPVADFLSSFGVAHVRRLSSSLKFCLVARGEADLYPRLGETSAWDTAAGQAILVAAGGVVTTRDALPLAYRADPSDWNNPPFVAWGDSGLVRPF